MHMIRRKKVHDIECWASEHRIMAFVQNIFFLFASYVNELTCKVLPGLSGIHRMYIAVVTQISILQTSASRE